MASLTNLRMSACTVTYGGVSLGHTKGGVIFKYAPKYSDLQADQYGETPIDKVLIGEDVTIKVSLAEPQIAVLNSIVPAGDYVGSTNERLGLGRDAGYSTRSDSKALVLHPVDRGATDYSEDVTIYKAVSSEPVDLNYEVDKQRIFEVTFTALVDETYASGRRLGHIGSTAVS